MKLKIYKTLWGFDGDYSKAIEQACDAGFDGIEGPAPEAIQVRQSLKHKLNDHRLDYIAEVTTAGSYVPDRHASLQDHTDTFKRKLDACVELKPRFVTCLGGCDAWPESENQAFFNKAMDIAAEYGVDVSFETHRGRAFFNPWVTQRLVKQLPGIKLTCDFSHWCVVCERLVDSELDIITELAGHAHHIHARVGYDQGPQVPHPGAPEYRAALHAHQRWWEIIWNAQLAAGYQTSTMTPEFGPDGYMQQLPFTRQPVGDLWQINQWMAAEERRHFNTFQNSRA
jgi:sugar phosphate isomerase/epimerase